MGGIGREEQQEEEIERMGGIGRGGTAGRGNRKKGRNREGRNSRKRK